MATLVVLFGSKRLDVVCYFQRLGLNTAHHPSICCQCWNTTVANSRPTVWTALRRPGRFRVLYTHRNNTLGVVAAVIRHNKVPLPDLFLFQNKFSEYEKRKVRLQWLDLCSIQTFTFALFFKIHFNVSTLGLFPYSECMCMSAVPLSFRRRSSSRNLLLSDTWRRSKKNTRSFSSWTPHTRKACSTQSDRYNLHGCIDIHY